MKILALSDSHCCGKPSSWTSLFDKRTIGLFNHHYLRKHQHDQKYMDLAVEYILANPPDVVICTGDITTSGEPSEFEMSINKLKPLVEDKRFDFFYVPGNHDNYVKNHICNNALNESLKYLNTGKFDLANMPYLFKTPEVDFCFVNESYPINLLLSSGKMKKKTLEFLYKWIESETAKPKIMVGHYPLEEEQNLFVRWRHKLYGQKKIIDFMRKGRLDLSICGHVHNPTSKINDKGRGEIIVGSVTRNACLAAIEYTKDNDVFNYKRIDL
jgi:UDP-2,3-diacylglucosamine pyrophosphatase LpxH